MTLFWILVAALLLVALLLIARPLLKPPALKELGSGALNLAIARERLAELESARAEGELSDEEFEQVKLELEQALAQDLGTDRPDAPAPKAAAPRAGPWAMAVVAVLLPALTLGLYFHLGSPDALSVSGPGRGAGDPHAAATSGGQPASVQELVGKLEQRLRDHPEDPDGWFLLGRTYMSLGRYGDAVQALERLHQLVGDNPAALVALADAVAMQQGGRMSGRPMELILKVLEQEPGNPTALWLAGKGAYETGDYAGAVGYWRKVEPLLAERPKLLAELHGLIAQAEQQAGGAIPATGAATAAPTTTAPAASQAKITVQVSLSPELAGKVDPQDTVFVFAKATQGPPMPLAVSRRRVKDLPLTVTLDDSMAMMPAMRLSKFPEVLVGARVSRSGQPIAQSGDYQSAPVQVAVGSTDPVALQISEQVP